MTAILVRLLPLALIFYATYQGRERIVDIGYQARDVALEYKTYIRMQDIVKILRLEIVDGHSPPEDLEGFLEENTMGGGDDATLDSWGTPFELEDASSGDLILRSCGPDAECRTEDDVALTVRDSEGGFQGGGGHLAKIEEKLRSFIGD